MRTSPLIGKKAWFGPHRIGWGLGPRSPEGWILTAVAVAASLITASRWPNRPAIRLLPITAYVVIAILKGTSPGGPREWRKLAGQTS
ncbi:MAG: hypothetical protein M0Z39_07150 [Actinomycetota bacterium]|nr:hypothetical protein [Actinomycetota bacterium]